MNTQSQCPVTDGPACRELAPCLMRPPDYAFYHNGTYEKVGIDRIERLQADGNHTLFYLFDKPKPCRVTNRSLGRFVTHPHFAPYFVRVNRSDMVRWDNVVRFGTEDGITMKDEKTYTTTGKWMPEMRKRCGIGAAF